MYFVNPNKFIGPMSKNEDKKLFEKCAKSFK